MPVGTPLSRENEENGAEPGRRNARRGLVLFALYCAVYAGFVLLAAFSPRAMASTPLAGLNVAVLYGVGLIGGAMALAVFYTWLCRGSAS